MIREDQTNQVRDIVTASQTILVILAKKTSADQAASAAALTLSLQALGKQVHFLTPEELPYESLAGSDQLQTQIGNQDLTVSFPYQPEKIDKVSYHIDENNQKFYLVIKPQKGQSPLEADQVEYSYTGATADLIFLIGVHEFESLDQLYFGYESLYESTPIVSFHTFETAIGNIKIDASGYSSQSEAMASFLFAINAPPVEAAASNLLLAIEEATDSFRSLATSADTFEIVAYLLRQGARRQRKATPAPEFQPKFAVEKPFESVAIQASQDGQTKQSRPQSHTDQKGGQHQDGHSKKNKHGKPGGLKFQPSGVAPSGGG